MISTHIYIYYNMSFRAENKSICNGHGSPFFRGSRGGFGRCGAQRAQHPGKHHCMAGDPSPGISKLNMGKSTIFMVFDTF